MATDVETGHGSEFWLDNASGTLTKIGEPFNVPIPNTEAPGLIDASHMDTVDYKDYIQERLSEGVESDIEMNWLPGGATETLLLEAKGKKRDYRIVIPVGEGEREFTGVLLVRNYVRENPMSERRTGVLTVKWLSAPVEAPVA